MNNLFRIALAVGVIWWGLDACTGPEARTIESFQAAASRNGWTPERATPPEPADRDVQLAEDFSDWLGTYSYSASFDASYSGASTWDVRSLQEVANTYPLPKSSVLRTLRQVAKQLQTANDLLEQRRYTSGAKALQQASAAMLPLKKTIANDWAAVEAQTGLRISDDGLVYDGTSDTRATIEEWVDGDTVITDQGRVRLIGIDSPEMSDQCSLAQDAKEYAEFLAPEGSTITLENPYSVVDEDNYGRLLRYIDLTEEADSFEGTDIGYSLLMSNLAKARYDSLDGYQWHPRQGPYRAAGAAPDRKGLCTWEDAAALILLAALGDDEDEEDRKKLRSTVMSAVGSAAHLPNAVASARSYHKQEDQWEAELRDLSDSDGGGSGSFDIPGWACPTRWC